MLGGGADIAESVSLSLVAWKLQNPASRKCAGLRRNRKETTGFNPT